MSERVNFLVTSGSDVGSAYDMGIEYPKDRPVGFQLDLGSADVSIQGTNFFDYDTNVGSLWVDIQSGTNISSSGLYVIDVSGVVFKGYRLLVNSVAGHVTAAFIQ